MHGIQPALFYPPPPRCMSSLSDSVATDVAPLPGLTPPSTLCSPLPPPRRPSCPPCPLPASPPPRAQVKEGLEGATIVALASGDCQTMALDISGRVYGWGCYKDKVGG